MAWKWRRSWRRAPELPRPVYNANVLVNHVSPRTHNERGGALSGKKYASFSPPNSRTGLSSVYIYIYTSAHLNII